MLTTKFLKDIMGEARPIIERQLDDAELIAGLRDVFSAQGGDWGALKALIKSQVQDERDDAGDGKRIRKLRDRSGNQLAYADMLGLGNMNEENSFADDDGFDPSTGEITEPQHAPHAAQATASGSGLVTSSVENEAAEISTIPAVTEALRSSRETDVGGGGEAIQPGTANETHERASTDDEASPEAGPQAEASPCREQVAGTLADREARIEGQGALASLPAPIYAAPGVIVMESCPPVGVVAHPYAACWPVNNIDASDGVKEPIVKIGNLILDGRGRYFAARTALIEYPVVQYAGTDPLMDCIAWNRKSRPDFKGEPLRIVAHKLAKLEPGRDDEIYAAMGIEVEVAA